MFTYTVDICRYEDPEAYKARPTLIGKFTFQAVSDEEANNINSALSHGNMFAYPYGDVPDTQLNDLPYVSEYSAERV